MAFIGFGSMIGFVVCLVLLIIKAITKKPKKKVVIALAVCFVLFVVALATPTNNSAPDPVEVTAEPTPEPTPAPTVEPTPEPTPEPTLEPTPEPSSVDVETVMALLKSLTEENFDYFTIEGDNTGITMCVGTEGLAAEVATAKLNGYDENYGNWPTVKENLVSFYNSTYDFIETLGLKNPVLTVAVVNDENPENVLLMIMYGIVVYDVMAE